MPQGDGGKTLETALVNIGVGIVAAAIGVWGGVQVHGAQIETLAEGQREMRDELREIRKDTSEIKERLARLEK